jgi:peroxiredoxin
MEHPVLVVFMFVAALAAAGLAVLLYQLVQQQGRLLLRLDEVEKRLGLEPVEDPSRRGLAVGTALPAFELPDLQGRPVALEQLRGRRVLLIHWSARCGFCTQIAPELAALAPDLEQAGVQLLLVSRGPAAAEQELAREIGLDGSVLLDAGGVAGVEAFQGVGTPAAYLLDEAGRVLEPLAVGAVEVPALARRIVEGSAGRPGARRRLRGERPLSASRIERNGLPAGTPAPEFELPTVSGGTVSLRQYRGRKLLLAFSDPHCGPCDQLAPHLVRLYREQRGQRERGHDGLGLLLVGRGDLAENRRRAEEHGFEFPVAVQRGWELSRRFGIFETPVGFLINENGILAQGVARGIEEILALAPQAPVEAGWKGAAR